LQDPLFGAYVKRFTYLRVKHDTSPLVNPEVLFDQTAVLRWEQAVRKTYQPIWRGHPSGQVGGGKRAMRWQKTISGEENVIKLQPKSYIIRQVRVQVRAATTLFRHAATAVIGTN
jgi:hypothetical protein